MISLVFVLVAITIAEEVNSHTATGEFCVDARKAAEKRFGFPLSREQRFLAAHNYFRCRHGMPRVYWDWQIFPMTRDFMQSKQLKHLDTNHKDYKKLELGSCVMVHSDANNLEWTFKETGATAPGYKNSIPPMGENLFMSVPGKSYLDEVEKGVEGWYSEIQYYPHIDDDSILPWNFPAVGHYTAMLWKDMDRIGCHSFLCNDFFAKNNGYPEELHTKQLGGCNYFIKAGGDLINSGFEIGPEHPNFKKNMPRTNTPNQTESECCNRAYSDEWLNLFEKAPTPTFAKSTYCANFNEHGLHEKSACPAFEESDDKYASINEHINGIKKKVVKGCCKNAKYKSNYPWFNMTRNDCNEGSTIELADGGTTKVDSSYVDRNGKRIFGDGKCSVCDPKNDEYMFCAYCDQSSGFFRVEENEQVFCKEFGAPDETLPPDCIDWAQPGINDEAGQTCGNHTSSMNELQLKAFCCGKAGNFAACESCCATCHEICKSCPATTPPPVTTADPNACVDDGSWDCSAYAAGGENAGYCCEDGMCEKCCKTCKDAGDCTKCGEKQDGSGGANHQHGSAQASYYSNGQINETYDIYGHEHNQFGQFHDNNQDPEYGNHVATLRGDDGVFEETFHPNPNPSQYYGGSLGENENLDQKLKF